jgi:hypothetical protein
MTGDIFHLGTDRARHCVDDPRPETGPLCYAVCAAPDPVILNNEFSPAVRKALQANADLTGVVRIGVFERVRHPFGDDYAQIDALIRFQLQGLQIVSQRGAVSLVSHRGLDIVEQARKIFIEFDKSRIA